MAGTGRASRFSDDDKRRIIAEYHAAQPGGGRRVLKQYGIAASTIQKWRGALGIPALGPQGLRSRYSDDDKRRIVSEYYSYPHGDYERRLLLEREGIGQTTISSWRNALGMPKPKRTLGIVEMPTSQEFAEAAKMQWLEHAACRDTPTSTFYPEDLHVDADGKQLGIRYNEARAVCRPCPVQRLCLAYAVDLGETEGCWGGLSPRQRRPLVAERARTEAA